MTSQTARKIKIKRLVKKKWIGWKCKDFIRHRHNYNCVGIYTHVCKRSIEFQTKKVTNRSEHKSINWIMTILKAAAVFMTPVQMRLNASHCDVSRYEKSPFKNDCE